MAPRANPGVIDLTASDAEGGAAKPPSTRSSKRKRATKEDADETSLSRPTDNRPAPSPVVLGEIEFQNKKKLSVRSSFVGNVDGDTNKVRQPQTRKASTALTRQTSKSTVPAIRTRGKTQSVSKDASPDELGDDRSSQDIEMTSDSNDVTASRESTFVDSETDPTTTSASTTEDGEPDTASSMELQDDPDEDTIIVKPRRPKTAAARKTAVSKVKRPRRKSLAESSSSSVEDIPRVKRRKLAPQKPQKPEKKMLSLLTGRSAPGLHMKLAPLSGIADIFADLTDKAAKLGLKDALDYLSSQPLRVATMCSGTESPLLALDMIKDAVAYLDLGDLQIDHLFSAEIVPFKQAYIERNFHPPIIFRDITELTSVLNKNKNVENGDQDGKPIEATTAYGGQAVIPTDVDIVIAGTSCVDFSGLNGKKKNIDDGGESGSTWNAVLDYCKAFLPAIVLLENVKNAPWEEMLKQYRKIGYVSAGVHVDSKDFYIPHTRQRGYMVCFHIGQLSKKETEIAGGKWASLMREFKRAASTPVSSFLLPSVAHRAMRRDEPRAEVDWSTCEITQLDYRQSMRLGKARPVTNWSESGSMRVPEHAYAPWFQNQVERVLDTIDGATLRKALPGKGGKDGMYDVGFKTRIWDLSQNIHRHQDTQPFGVSTCITPSGIFYVSDAGRVLAPEETLTLQGIPLDRISFTTESPADMQDLAGNAMTSTVIGSAILAALIAGHKVIRERTSEVKKLPEPVVSSLELVSGTTEALTSKFGVSDINVQDLVAKGRQASRKCYCEGPKGATSKRIQTCADCGHTTCIGCGGNPKHNYLQNSRILDRVSPADFQDEMRACLPLRLQFQSLDSMPNVGGPPEHRDAVIAAAKQMFSFEGVRRTYCWTATYSAPNARLEFVIDDVHAEWRLFVLPDKHLPGDSVLRAVLQQPAAKASVSNSLLDVEWLWRVPKEMGFASSPLKIFGSGSTISSWWTRNGMPDFEAHMVPEYLDIRTTSDANEALTRPLDGRYQYLPECGKACSSLYKKIGCADGAQPLFLFLDPTRTGKPDEDRFVFSENIARLEYDEVRPIVARIAAPWRPWSTKDQKVSPGLNKGKLVITEDWISSQQLRLVPDNAEFVIRSPSDPAAVADGLKCAQALGIVGCHAPVDLIHEHGENSTAVVRSQDVIFFKANAWVFEAMRRYLPPQEWTTLQDEQPDRRCATCAPAKPELRWKLTGDTVRPYDDPKSAAEYERAVKARPDPIVFQLSIHDPHKVDVGLNVISLAHRARARLPSDLSNVETAWKLDTSGQSKGFTFKPFILSATRGIQPCDNEGLGLKVDLFPKQLLTLAWMQSQESGDGASLILEEAEEATVPSLGWRAEVRVKGTIRVRGGICADHPGFGKTITSLALIKSQFKKFERSDIEADLAERQLAVAPGLYVTAATLIVCPRTLVSQWVDEIHEKLGWTGEGEIIAINTVADLKNCDIDDFKGAKIIVANRKLFGPGQYSEELAAFAAVPGPATTSGRAFGQWLAYATQQIPKHLDILEVEGKEALKTQIARSYKANVASNDFKAVVPSKRLRGQAYMNAKSTIATAAKAKVAPGKVDTKNVGIPLFEMFFFNRLIVDEFHQDESKEHATIVALKADKRWGLSGTPAMGDFYDLAQMGGLLTIPLRLGSDAKGIMKLKNSRELRKDLSDFELFDAMRHKPSDVLHTRIHEIAQKFLDTFVRQNIMDHAKMEVEDRLIPVQLDLAHSVSYLELSQHLNSLDMRIKKGKKKADDRKRRIDDAIASSTTAEQALSKYAAYTTDQEIDKLVADRKRDARKIMAGLPAQIAVASKDDSAAFEGWKMAIVSGNFGDDKTTAAIKALLETPATPATPATPDTPDTPKSEAGEQLIDVDDTEPEESDDSATVPRARTAALNQRCKRLLAANRSLRYLQSVQRLQRAVQTNSNSIAASCCDRKGGNHGNAGATDIAISAVCGHMLCRGCHEDLKRRAISQCPVDGCSNAMQDFHYLWSNKIGDLCKPSKSPYGAKFETVIELLDGIADIGDQAVLFVQFDGEGEKSNCSGQLSRIKTALEERNILAEVVENSAKVATQVENFRDSAKTKKPITVMVLSASSDSAAGLNLQNANHVIFLSPLLSDTQYGYDATMAQTIGRVRRHGQEKDIYVYRIAALDTIDVDILEHREKRVDALAELGAPGLAPPQGIGAGKGDEHCEPVRERMQLVREDGSFSLRPQSWLIRSDSEGAEKVQGKRRVTGWEDYSSLVKFSHTFTEDDDDA